MTLHNRVAIADEAIRAHDPDALAVAADSFEEAGDLFTAYNLRWRALEARHGGPNGQWSWT